MQSIKVALVYDRVNKFGGAERVLLALHTIFPKAPLFTSVYHSEKAPWAKSFRIYTSFLQHVPFAKSYHQFFAPFMPIAFRSFRFDEYDVVISVTSEFAKAVKVRGKTVHISICLTPTRYLWSGYEEYFNTTLFRMVTKPLVKILQYVDKKMAQNPHHIIAISKEVQKRIKKYYQRESKVIYPPVTLVSSKKQKIVNVKKKDYYLVVSRLSRFTSYKRVDLAIQAATKAGVSLIVVGPGNTSMFGNSEGKHIQFAGSVSDKKLQEYYAYAKALIFPGIEDFGLTMIEAQAAGIPVIAFRAGGALEIVKEGETGTFFAKQTVNALVGVLEKFDEKLYNSKSIRENAKRFSFSYFEKSLKEYILKVI